MQASSFSKAGNDQGAQRHDSDAGAAVYSPLALKAYDLWVLGFSNRWAWQCSTRDVLLPFYRANVGPNHLEVGVGTGFYPANAGFGAGQRITLLDLNPNTLAAASRRLRPRAVEARVVDILKPLPPLERERFDSISLFYLLHCLPGDMAYKANAFASLKTWLKPEGVLFGATILGDAAEHNRVGRMLMKVYNRKGIFGNLADTLESLQAALEAHFAEVQVRQQGKVALFSARLPSQVSS